MPRALSDELHNYVRPRRVLDLWCNVKRAIVCALRNQIYVGYCPNEAYFNWATKAIKILALREFSCLSKTFNLYRPSFLENMEPFQKDGVPANIKQRLEKYIKSEEEEQNDDPGILSITRTKRKRLTDAEIKDKRNTIQERVSSL